MKAYVYSVSQINKYIKNLLEKDIFLKDIFIEAEISNFKAHSSGHFYFTLKDEKASLSAVMYKSYSENLHFLPEDGMRVTVYGYISIYEKTGRYQMYAQIMEPSGKGALYVAFEQLKEKLFKEGLFDEAYKKSIPRFPRKIAVLTSPTGAAVRDIIRISQRRNPNVKIVVVPVLVQGKQAAKSICEGLSLINRYKDVDLIILGRGGGSIEDLWCFNEESVARAVFKSKLPVISAIGHETDFTITDFVADIRASTPSAAAEIAVWDIEGIAKNVFSLYNELNYRFENRINGYKNIVKGVIANPFFKQPLKNISERVNYINECVKNMDKAVLYNKERAKIRFEGLAARLESVSPINVVRRGFSIVYKEDKPIGSVKSLREGDIIETRLSDGYIKSEIVEKGEDDAKEKDF